MSVLAARTLQRVGLAASGLFGLWFLYKTGTIAKRLFYPFLLGRPKNLHKLAGAKWAVITGASEGIGRGYATELAARGFDIVLISRSQSKLTAAADELRAQQPGVEVRTISFDFSNANLDDYERQIFRVLDQLDVGILVNNVGYCYDYPERFDLQRDCFKRSADQVVINALPTTLLSAYVLQRMTKRRSGVIVNVAAAGGLYPMPLLAVYSAIKTYVIAFTEILRKEYAGSGITIQSILPLIVTTEMSRFVERKPSTFVLTPQSFARAAVRTIGLADQTTGCFPHELQAVGAFTLLPSFLLDRFLWHVNGRTRANALAQLALQDIKAEEHGRLLKSE